MKTSEQLTLPFGETVSTFSPADSRASRSASPVREKAREMTAISGRRCLELFGRFVPAGSWAKTFSELLIGRRDWFSSRCVLTWKMRATKSNRSYFQLAASMLPTYATERLLLPTAQTQGLKICVKGKTVFMPLGFMPTPTARDYQSPGKHGKGGLDLRTTVLSGTGKGFRLNPRFVAEMMGFPVDWTALPFQVGAGNPSKPTATP